MSTQKIVNANAVKHNGGTVLAGGNVDGVNMTNELSPRENAFKVGYASEPRLPTGGAGSSGNIGTFKPLSAGAYNTQEEANYVIHGYTTRLNKTANSAIATPASDKAGRRPFNNGRGNRKLGVVDFSYASGVPTYNGEQGVSFTYINPVGGGSIGMEAYPTRAVPGELVYMEGGVNPTQDDYAANDG